MQQEGFRPEQAVVDEGRSCIRSRGTVHTFRCKLRGTSLLINIIQRRLTNTKKRKYIANI
jgi:hypothetical protein